MSVTRNARSRGALILLLLLLLLMYMNMCIVMRMNIYISKSNEQWLRIQDKSMSGIINQLLDEARAGKHGPHVIARYDNLEDAMRSDRVVPYIENIKQNPDGTISPIDPKKPSKLVTTKPAATELPKKIEQVIKAKDPDIKLCKHGYPANGWSCKKGCTK